MLNLLYRAASPSARSAFHPEADAELLNRFVAHRDEGAFEVLVARHERRARAAASRVLRDPATVADVVQATLLVFLRHASRLNGQNGLGPWFFGVSHRIAVRAAAWNQRVRPLEEREAGTVDELSLREGCAILHAELDQLPERYRLPLLLCYLEGKTRDEAATELGVSIGTVKGRVRRGLRILERRLTCRGVSLSLGALAGLGSQACGGSVLPDVRAGGSPSWSFATRTAGMPAPCPARKYPRGDRAATPLESWNRPVGSSRRCCTASTRTAPAASTSHGRFTP